MRTEFPYLQASDSLGDVMQRLSNGSHTLIPVFEEKELAGVLDLENITEYLIVQNAINKS
jgi:CBS domain containing-hemolysin-like protein